MGFDGEIFHQRGVAHAAADEHRLSFFQPGARHQVMGDGLELGLGGLLSGDRGGDHGAREEEESESLGHGCLLGVA